MITVGGLSPPFLEGKMKFYKRIILEDETLMEVMYIKPKSSSEIDEIPHQAQMDGIPGHLQNQLHHLSSPSAFRASLSKAKLETYDANKIQGVQNTDATEPDSFSKLDKNKQDRVKKAFRGTSVETPIILRHKESGYEHLLAGNTRATYAMKKFGKFKASVIEY